eukprot:scaffold7381_cov310-Pinguiococcus_pyrenoidosus.AAC.107
MCKSRHRVLAFRDALGVGKELITQPALLHVKFVRIRLAVDALEALLVGADYSAACRGAGALANAQVLAHLSEMGDADVGPEEDEDVPVLWHVVREGREARLPRKGDTRDASEREDLSEVQAEQVAHVPRLVVDLVAADRVAIQRVLSGHAILLMQHRHDPRHHRLARKCRRKAGYQALTQRRFGWWRPRQPLEHRLDLLARRTALQQPQAEALSALPG